MTDDRYLSRIHAELLPILKEVVRVCDENNIFYCLEGGTLLGAVRHHGFIPWDDDIDIMMPRAEFERFVRIAPEKLGPDYGLGWADTDPSWPLLYAKVYRKGTSFVEAPDEGSTWDTGLFVDIFPFDESPGVTGSARRKRRLAMYFYTLLMHSITRHFSGNPVLALIEKALLALFRPSGVVRLASRMFKGKNGTHYSSYPSVYSLERSTFPKSCYEKTLMLPFEDATFRAPAGYDTVLRTVYGDYMQLPPEEKRVAHHPLLVRFPDGETFDFRKP